MRERQIHAEQINLLYLNASTGFAVTVAVASVLSWLQWGVVSHAVVLAWLAYMIAASLARFGLARRYWSAPPETRNSRPWGAAFAAGVALAAAGWGAAGVLLYPAPLTNQLFLAFVLGGMMLGAGSTLAARPEGFLIFILPTGLPIAARCLMQPDDLHRAMGLLALVFTLATLATTWHVYLTVRSSLNLQFENKELVASLRAANQRAETLNRELERRVQERTAELHDANERLRAEIDRRKQTEEELVRARKLEALAVLAGGIAHDFNNFLTIIQGNIGLAKLDLDREHPASELLDRTAAACQRAGSLATQLMTFGKGGAPVRRTTGLGPLVRDAAELARAGANVALDLDTAAGLWPAEIDAAQVSHALENILINARQAMPQGGVIQVRAENLVLNDGAVPLPAGKYVRISVRDSGCGIPPEHLPRIFDPYFTTKPAGTGLGLAAAYSIAAKHGGHITVESAPGAGTTFRMYLPAAERAAAPEPSPGEVLRSGAGRILVMDDEQAIRTALTLILARLGYEVVCAMDGAEAVACYERGREAGCGFDAVLLDLTVPGGPGGVEAAARLKQIDPAARLIASSGYSDAAVMSDFRKYGFDDALPKPWTPAQVSEVLQRVLCAGHAGDLV